MAERRTGAGGRLGSVLERAAQPEPPVDPADPDEPAQAPEPTDDAPAKGRGATGTGASARKARATRVKARTVYLHDDLYERIIVQAHRRGMRYSDYIAAVLERNVPDHRARPARGARVEPAEGQGETAA